jgi:hypothetical protein
VITRVFPVGVYQDIDVRQDHWTLP